MLHTDYPEGPLFPEAVIREAQERWVALRPHSDGAAIPVASLNVAGWDGTESALAYRQGDCLDFVPLPRGRCDETMRQVAARTSEWVASLPLSQKPHVLRVITDALGGGVRAMLCEHKSRNPEVWGHCRIETFSWGSKPKRPDLYRMAVDERHFALREALDAGVALPPGEDVLEGLSARGWDRDAFGQRRVETMHSLKQRGVRNPHRAQALVACAPEPAAPRQPQLATV